jgi:molybdopterin/thiamine biosynthesis adenylyltransferase
MLNERYSRQELLPGIGEAGQRRLLDSKVAIVGCGAIGTGIAALLGRAGVGRIKIVDRDYVELSNLQRQSLFDEADARESLPKAVAAARKIASLNSAIQVIPLVADLTPDNVGVLLEDVDVVFDGTDNFETRYLINDFCVSKAKPWIYSAAVGSYGVTMNILPRETACLACFFEQPPQATETCDTVGILGSAVQLVASIAAAEGIKLLAEGRTHLRLRLLSWDVWDNTHAEVDASRPRMDCRVCQQSEFQHLSGRARPQVTLCGRNSVQIHERRKAVDFQEMGRKLGPHGKVRHNEFILKFWCGPYEMTLFPDGRAIIKGTTDAAVARSLYARFIGA